MQRLFQFICFSVTSAACSVLVLLWHAIHPSILSNSWDEFAWYKPLVRPENIDWIFSEHVSTSGFAIRKGTSQLVIWLSELCSMDLYIVYAAMQFTMLGLAGVLIGYLGHYFVKNLKNCCFVIIGFFFTFSTLHSFFFDIYAFDEPIFYCLLFAGFLLYLNNRFWLFLLTWSLATIFRESVIILLPGIALLNYLNQDLSSQQKRTRFFLMGVVPIFWVFYGYLLLSISGELEMYLGYTEAERMSHFFSNTKSPKRIWNSVGSFFLECLLPTVLMIFYRPQTSLQKNIKWAFGFTMFLNTVIVLWMTNIRETRLLALPFLFYWPLLTLIIPQLWSQLQNSANRLRLVPALLVSLSILLLWALFSYELYQPNISEAVLVFCGYLYAAGLLVILGFVSLRMSGKRRWIFIAITLVFAGLLPTQRTGYWYWPWYQNALFQSSEIPEPEFVVLAKDPTAAENYAGWNGLEIESYDIGKQEGRRRLIEDFGGQGRAIVVSLAEIYWPEQVSLFAHFGDVIWRSELSFSMQSIDFEQTEGQSQAAGYLLPAGRIHSVSAIAIVPKDFDPKRSLTIATQAGATNQVWRTVNIREGQPYGDDWLVSLSFCPGEIHYGDTVRAYLEGEGAKTKFVDVRLIDVPEFSQGFVP